MDYIGSVNGFDTSVIVREGIFNLLQCLFVFLDVECRDYD